MRCFTPSLSQRQPARGDTAEMVAARAAFLEAGHYAPIADAIVAAAGAARFVVDLGAASRDHGTRRPRRVLPGKYSGEICLRGRLTEPRALRH